MTAQGVMENISRAVPRGLFLSPLRKIPLREGNQGLLAGLSLGSQCLPHKASKKARGETGSGAVGSSQMADQYWAKSLPTEKLWDQWQQSQGHTTTPRSQPSPSLERGQRHFSGRSWSSKFPISWLLSICVVDPYYLHGRDFTFFTV